MVTDLGQHSLRQWFAAWWQQAIVWTNVNLSSVKSSDTYLRAISPDLRWSSITKIRWKLLTYLPFKSPRVQRVKNGIIILYCLHILTQISLKFFSWGSNGQYVSIGSGWWTWCRTGNKPLPKPRVIQSTDLFTHHQSLCLISNFSMDECKIKMHVNDSEIKPLQLRKG